MISIRKIRFRSFFIFLLALVMCVCGSFSCAEEVEYDFQQEFDQWQAKSAKEWGQFEKLDLDSDWFTGYRLPADVYAFLEFPYEQDVCSFLILGKEKALLLDTGTGMAPLRPLVDKLTDLPLTVLNSHDHFDHIGGNAEFDEVWCYDDEATIRHLTHGPTEVELQTLAAEFESLSEVMDVSAFRVPDHIPGKAPTGTVKEGQIIDLGGRTLEVLFTPGHTHSSIMLLDSENKLLFTADTYYPGPLYAMFGDSSFPDYVVSVRKAADRAVKEKIEWVYCSHNYVKKGTDQLCRLADFLEDIQSGTIKPNETLWDDELYIMDDEISIFIVINLSEEDEPEAEKAARIFPIPANHPDGQLSAVPMDLSA